MRRTVVAYFSCEVMMLLLLLLQLQSIYYQIKERLVYFPQFDPLMSYDFVYLNFFFRVVDILYSYFSRMDLYFYSALFLLTLLMVAVAYYRRDFYYVKQF